MNSFIELELASQENEIEEYTSPEDLLNENPKKFIEMLIKKKDWEVPSDLEKKIAGKYSANIEKVCQRKVKDIFRLVLEFKEEDQIDEDSIKYT